MIIPQLRVKLVTLSELLCVDNMQMNVIQRTKVCDTNYVYEEFIEWKLHIDKLRIKSGIPGHSKNVPLHLFKRK